MASTTSAEQTEVATPAQPAKPTNKVPADKVCGSIIEVASRSSTTTGVLAANFPELNIQNCRVKHVIESETPKPYEVFNTMVSLIMSLNHG